MQYSLAVKVSGCPLGDKIGILTNLFLTKLEKLHSSTNIKQNRFRQTKVCFPDVPSIFCKKVAILFAYNFDIPSVACLLISDFPQKYQHVLGKSAN